MANSLSNLVNNLAGGIHKIKCKYRHDNKKCETGLIKYKNCECCLEYTNVKSYIIEYKCLSCNKKYQKDFDKNKKRDLLIHINLLIMMSISLFKRYLFM